MRDMNGHYGKNELGTAVSYHCGHCNRHVVSERGWMNQAESATYIAICPGCGRPTYFEHGTQLLPGAKPGNDVSGLPNQVEILYEEARRAMASDAPTTAALALRKLLMHVAVDKGARVGLSFQKYVDYLDTERLVPAGAKAWIDHIRTKGNEANHEIVILSPEEGNEILIFTEMLLKLIYEFPQRLVVKAPAAAITPQAVSRAKPPLSKV